MKRGRLSVKPSCDANGLFHNFSTPRTRFNNGVLVACECVERMFGYRDTWGLVNGMGCRWENQGCGPTLCPPPPPRALNGRKPEETFRRISVPRSWQLWHFSVHWRSSRFVYWIYLHLRSRPSKRGKIALQAGASKQDTDFSPEGVEYVNRGVGERQTYSASTG